VTSVRYGITTPVTIGGAAARRTGNLQVVILITR